MSDTLEEHACGKCGIRFAAPSQWWDQKRETGEGWYCPNGHSRVFAEPESVKMRRERDRLAQRVAERDDEIKRQRELREAAERREAAQKANVTKLKKRAGAGVCPCCNRTFLALQKHMQQKHPKFVCEPADNVVPLKGARA